MIGAICFELLLSWTISKLFFQRNHEDFNDKIWPSWLIDLCLFCIAEVLKSYIAEKGIQGIYFWYYPYQLTDKIATSINRVQHVEDDGLNITANASHTLSKPYFRVITDAKPSAEAGVVSLTNEEHVLSNLLHTNFDSLFWNHCAKNVSMDFPKDLYISKSNNLTRCLMGQIYMYLHIYHLHYCTI